MKRIVHFSVIAAIAAGGIFASLAAAATIRGSDNGDVLNGTNKRDLIIAKGGGDASTRAVPPTRSAPAPAGIRSRAAPAATPPTAPAAAMRSLAKTAMTPPTGAAGAMP